MTYKELTDVLIKIDNNILKKHPILRINEQIIKNPILNENIISIDGITANQILVGCECHNYDIRVNTVFNVLIPYCSVEKYTLSNVSLDYISINRSYEIDYLPAGYYGVGILNFKGKIPNVIHMLKQDSDKFDLAKNEIFFLLQRELLDMILENKIFLPE